MTVDMSWQLSSQEMFKMLLEGSRGCKRNWGSNPGDPQVQEEQHLGPATPNGQPPPMGPFLSLATTA